MKRNKKETEQTIQRLIKVARHYFASYGYTHVSLEDIVKEAGLTRGALYHHFKNKEGLFLAVFEEIQKEVGETVESTASKSDDEWEQLLNGCRAFLEAALESQNQRILLIDGPAVLGWTIFREMDEKYSMNSLNEQLETMHYKNMLKPISIEAMTHCLSGAMNEAVLWISGRLEQKDIIDEAMIVLSHMLKGLKK